MEFIVKFFKNKESGQSLLIVVLVMIIALTVGLALISRTITSIKTSTEEASSQKALGAAEAGIEQSLKNPDKVPQGIIPFGSESTFQTSISPIVGKSFLVNGGDVVQRDDNVDVWMSDYSTESAKLYQNPVPQANIWINFGESLDPCQNPAIEVDVVSGSKAAPIQKTYAYDACPSRNSNNFSAPAPGSGDIIDGVSFLNKTVAIPVSSGLFMRVIPIYKNGKIGITSDVSLPSQGSVVASTGISGTTKRKVSVYQGFPKIPAEFFPYTLFSP